MYDVENPVKPSADVECYSGYRYGERPLAFHWHGERLEIEQIETQERHREGWFFRVVTCGGQIFELLFDEGLDNWVINHSG